MLKMVVPVLLILAHSMIVAAGRPDETAAITETALNYMEGWYKGDASRMKASLHKKLAKRSLQESYGGRRMLSHTSASDMIAFTRGQYGTALWRKDLAIEVVVLDQSRHIASVKVVTPHYYEYLHLAKTERGWVIVNTLYEK